MMKICLNLQKLIYDSENKYKDTELIKLHVFYEDWSDFDETSSCHHMKSMFMTKIITRSLENIDFCIFSKTHVKNQSLTGKLPVSNKNLQPSFLVPDRCLPVSDRFLT